MSTFVFEGDEDDFAGTRTLTIDDETRGFRDGAIAHRPQFAGAAYTQCGEPFAQQGERMTP